MKNYEYFFKKDPKPVVELAYKALGQIVLVGDILVPALKSNIIDEVRFYSKDISFIKGGAVTHYKYKEVKAEISHSITVKSKKNDPFIKVRFVADDGKIFNLDLTQKSNTFRTSSFSTHHRDFLFQVASKLPRLREKRFKYRKSYFLELCCAAMLLVIVLAG